MGTGVGSTGSRRAAVCLRHVFERVAGADSTNVRVHGGLGVGLAIVRYIVELHGGTVTVESLGKGAGSTFTVIIPVRATLSSKAKKAKRISKTLTSLTGLRLLVVDDEPHT